MRILAGACIFALFEGIAVGQSILAQDSGPPSKAVKQAPASALVPASPNKEVTPGFDASTGHEAWLSLRPVVCRWADGELFRATHVSRGGVTHLVHRKIQGDALLLPPSRANAVRGKFIGINPIRFFCRGLELTAENQRSGDPMQDVVFAYRDGTWTIEKVARSPWLRDATAAVDLGDGRYAVFRWEFPFMVRPGVFAKCMWLKLDEKGARTLEFKALELEGDGEPGDTGVTDRLSGEPEDPTDFNQTHMAPNMTWQKGLDETDCLRGFAKGFLVINPFTGTIYTYTSDGDLSRRIRLLDPFGVPRFFDMAGHPPIIHDAQECPDGTYLVATRPVEAIAQVAGSQDWPGGGYKEYWEHGVRAHLKTFDKQHPEIQWWSVDLEQGTAARILAPKGVPTRLPGTSPFRFELDAHGNVIPAQGYLVPKLKGKGGAASVR